MKRGRRLLPLFTRALIEHQGLLWWIFFLPLWFLDPGRATLAAMAIFIRPWWSNLFFEHIHIPTKPLMPGELAIAAVLMMGGVHD